MAKTVIPARANGPTSEDTIPVSAKSSGPATLKQRQFFSTTGPASSVSSRISRIFCGTLTCGQTMESSSAVRVIDKNDPVTAQSGIGAVVSRRQMAKVSGKIERVSLCVFMQPHYCTGDYGIG